MLKKLYETQAHIKLTYIGLKVLQNATLTCPVNVFVKEKNYI